MGDAASNTHFPPPLEPLSCPVVQPLGRGPRSAEPHQRRLHDLSWASRKEKKNITITAALHYSVMKYNNAFYKKKCALPSRKPGPVCKLTSSPSKLLQLQGGVWLTVGYVLQFKLQLFINDLTLHVLLE